MNQRSILIVDDEAHVIRVLRLVLEREGYQVEGAADGAEALEKMRMRRPEVMVTDIQMDGMDGRALCHATRERYPDDPFLILVMTSMTGSGEREWVRNLKNVEFLEKPLSPRQLSTRLAAHFAARAAQQEKPDASAS
jgi:CheY-like chemotaxis protein